MASDTAKSTCALIPDPTAAARAAADLIGASAGSVLVLGSLSVAVSGPGLFDLTVRRQVLRGTAGYFVLVTVVNAVSRSVA